jgi:hypothetical protein
MGVGVYPADGDSLRDRSHSITLVFFSCFLRRGCAVAADPEALWVGLYSRQTMEQFDPAAELPPQRTAHVTVPSGAWIHTEAADAK